ncbi:MAG: ABC transporter ATP-binding protein [Cyanobacteria bacterium J06632_22]
MSQALPRPPLSGTTSARVPAAPATAVPDVELLGVVKRFDNDIAVKGLDLTIRRGEFFSILGPSGCGKTTTLRMIAGFDTPTEGTLLIQGQSMTQVPTHRRPVNTVFQNYALFDHMSAWDNVAFGLRVKKVSKAEVRSQVGEALKLVRMEDYAQKYPQQLSGGQRQRIALARALVNRPTVMLLDEPLGALDLKLRKQMQFELAGLHQRLGVTFIMVTHDQEEALSLSDRIAVMRDGTIEQVGTPSEIYEQPQTAFVADFIGETNLLSGEIHTDGSGRPQVATSSGLRIQVNDAPSTGAVDVSIRPEKIDLSPQAPTQADNCYPGQVRHTMYLGTHVHCVVELTTGDQLMVLQPNQAKHLPDSKRPVYVSWAAADCRALAR